MNTLTLRRVAFVCFALAVVTATHWPALQIASHGVNRLDLYIHAATFGTWAFLFICARFFGPSVFTTRNIVGSTLAALAYALVDELTQGIPILRRTVDPLDLTANATGILLVGLGMLAVARLRRTPDRPDNQ